MVDEIAVEVHIVLIHAPVPGEAIGVDAMDENKRGIGGETGCKALHHECGLHARSAITLYSVGAGAYAEYAARIFRPETGNIGRKRLAIRPIQRVLMVAKCCACFPRGCEKLLPRLQIGARKMPCRLRHVLCPSR